MIDLGSVYGVAVDVFDADGDLANPVTATLEIGLPDGTTAAPTVPLPPADTGKLRYPYVTGLAGRHTVRVVTTNPVTVYTDEFDVAPSESGAIVSLARGKQQLGMDPADTSDDDELRDFIIGLTGALEFYKKQVIVPRSFTEQVSVRCPSRRFRLWSAPLLSLVSVQSWDGSVTWDASAVTMRVSRSGIVKVMTGPPVHGELDVVCKAGLNPIPPNYITGGLIVLEHVWETQRGVGLSEPGVVGPEEIRARGASTFTIPNKAREYLGAPVPVVG